MNFISDDTNRERLDIAPRLVLIEIGPVPEGKPPVMNPATDGVIFDDSVREGGAGMRAFVGQSEEVAFDVEYANHCFRDGEHAAFTLRDIIDAADGMKVGRILILHGGIVLVSTLAHARY